ncbi:hypothetical protein [Actinoplanes sp. GCM10030250]|uniref:hypothetical protein n=1 Tax=Actinoplanes sp. GCM10030250 TaxID=3273376 RepID=UPI0036235C35
MTAVPRRIPIAREPGDHTGFTGVHDEGLFLGSIVLKDHWLAVLHLFGHDGEHRSSEIRDAGPAAGADRARAHLEGLVTALPGAQFGDIAIRPFRLERDGVLFGLIAEDDYADLLPNGLRFGPPWDGEFET